MDEERLEGMSAQVFASHVILTALIDLSPDRELLRQTIEMHAKALISLLPIDTEEQRRYIEKVWRRLNAFSELLQESDHEVP